MGVLRDPDTSLALHYITCSLPARRTKDSRLLWGTVSQADENREAFMWMCRQLPSRSNGGNRAGEPVQFRGRPSARSARCSDESRSHSRGERAQQRTVTRDRAARRGGHALVPVLRASVDEAAVKDTHSNLPSVERRSTR